MILDDIDQDHLKQFASSLEKVIAKYCVPKKKDFLEVQREQVEKLVALEKEFRETVIQHKYGTFVYEKFIHFIHETKRNILAARPYYRERQPVFSKRISIALKNKDVVELQKFHFNYNFVAFALSTRKWGEGSEIVRIANEIKRLRIEIVELNMPLAISRARIFYSKTPKSHLSFMDLVQISSEGLMSAIDKFVPPFSSIFRSVAVGRISGFHIDMYSETMVHFYPSDRRKLYRANKIVHKFCGDVNYEQLAQEINDFINQEDIRTNADEIADLMAAASCVSSNALPCEENQQNSETIETINKFEAPAEDRPDLALEMREAKYKIQLAMENLSVFERKLLELKGISTKGE